MIFYFAYFFHGLGVGEQYGHVILIFLTVPGVGHVVGVGVPGGNVGVGVAVGVGVGEGDGCGHVFTLLYEAFLLSEPLVPLDQVILNVTLPLFKLVFEVTICPVFVAFATTVPKLIDVPV
jgi:hypothetical protein